MKSVVMAKVKLPFDERLLKTMEAFTKAVRFSINQAWEFEVITKEELHDTTYKKIREKFGLHSQLAINVITQSWNIIKKSKKKPDISDYFPVKYNFPRCASINENWDRLSLATIEGRVNIPIKIPEYFEKYLDWEVKESLLIKKKDKLFFCFAFAKEVDIQVRNNRKVLGIDLGINNIAVTSDGKFYKGIKYLRKRHDGFVGELQAKGTPACKRKLKKTSGRWKRFMSWINHNISKEIIDALREGDILVMEDLLYIRESVKYNKWVHKWAFRQLQFFIEYKATKKGIRVVYVNPKYTSKRCNRCHSIKTERHNGFFKCKVCGHTINADLNGARNIAQRYMRINGLGSCKSASNLMCDEVKASVPLCS